MTKNKPAHEIRLGLVKATIWENSVSDPNKPNASYYSVTLSRRYKDGEEWKTAESFRGDDLLLVAKAADQAHTWIFEQRAK